MTPNAEILHKVRVRSSRVHPTPVAVGSRPATKGRRLAPRTKWDGIRFQVIKDGAGVRMYSKSGAEYTARLPRMVEAFGKLPAQSAILDGELVLINPRGCAHFYH